MEETKKIVVTLDQIKTDVENRLDQQNIENEFKENQDDKLSLIEYFNLCLKFEDEPTDENMREIQDFLSDLEIKDFLSLKEKTIVAIQITSDLIDELDASGAASTLEIGKLFKGLLSYVVNLKNDIGVLDRTFIAYDYCYIYGLADAILRVCSKDYQHLCSYLDNMINMSNAYRLIQTASILNKTEYNKWVNTLNDLKEKITPEMLQSLLSIDAMNNGGDDLKTVLGAMAAEEVEKSLQKDAIKYDNIAQDLDNKLNHINTEDNKVDEK